MKIYKTKSGIIIQYQDQYFLSAELNWDKFVNRPQLHKRVKEELINLKPDASLIALISKSMEAPIGNQEVWASGVTYMRSREARMEESKEAGGGDFYARVYEAERPELFFKAMPDKVVPPGESVGIRTDAKWSVPEPELALVINCRGKIAGLTIGNDMSSRDIEGENLLYLPQAKIYDRSCALGPWITLGVAEALAREWSISIGIRRNGKCVFEGQTSLGKIKRSFEELAGYLFRSLVFPNGAILLTGTGIVPPDTFTLQAGDVVEIEVDGIGVLQNPVVTV